MMKFTVVTSLCLALASGAKLRPSRLRQTSLIAESSNATRHQVKFEGTLPSFMHTSDQIHDELASMVANCAADFSIKTHSKSGADGRQVDIDTVSIKGKGASPKNKVFLLFGEHARELISAESGLHFMKQLCSGSERANTVLAGSEFRIVPNGNPGSRRAVEAGDYCKRVNPEGVDLNRNWDSHWEPEAVFASEDTNPGSRAFSEPETQIFKELVSEYNPTTFLTIHSGTMGMYMPWAFDMDHLANKNQPQMMQLLEELDKDHCQCPFGAAGREVGYSCPGTCLDWVFSNLDTQYAFAFEIYYGGDHEELRSRWQAKVAEVEGGSNFLQMNSTHLAHDKLKPFFEEFPSTFVQLKSEKHRHQGMSSFDCFGMFNPTTEMDYQSTVENWSQAYMDMSEKIAAKL
eukprot:TRINITY_DN14330_c3_g1_i1.p1 TRINITY_DN14330_c3_g1~~TRINITY_DN14330_c3_g1_i1.p1  ORF type:complete len:403 (-),score=86.18 TRINITY_DN14330_c3_g1_i1:117-1325(-)